MFGVVLCGRIWWLPCFSGSFLSSFQSEFGSGVLAFWQDGITRDGYGWKSQNCLFVTGDAGRGGTGEI